MNGSDLSDNFADVVSLLEEESRHLPEDMIDAPPIYGDAEPPRFAKDRIMTRVKKDMVTFYIAGSDDAPAEV